MLDMIERSKKKEEKVKGVVIASKSFPLLNIRSVSQGSSRDKNHDGAQISGNGMSGFPLF
jgi:hypothetical protein